MSGSTPTSNHSVLALLRADPDAAMGNYGFVVDSSVYTKGSTGGQCLITCEAMSAGLYRLTATQGSGDWYFPYYTDGDGVGDCSVPLVQVDGTIATTGGMNGCSLQVNKNGGNYDFYHDRNGNAMAATGKTYAGTKVCRVNWRDYAGPLNIGANLADSFRRSSEEVRVSANDVNYCICVRQKGRWKVYYSAIMVIGTTKMGYTWTFSRTSTKSVEYLPFKPTITPLITSFGED